MTTVWTAVLLPMEQSYITKMTMLTFPVIVMCLYLFSAYPCFRKHISQETPFSDCFQI